MLSKIVLTLLTITALFYIYKRYKTHEEAYLGLKLVGFYILGSLKFKINSLALPAGFVVFLLFFKESTNAKAKKAAAYVGLLIFFSGLLMPKLQEAYFERERKVAVSSTNIYSLDFAEDLKVIKEKLDVEGRVKIEDFHVNFETSGKIQNLSFSFLTRDIDGFIIYHVNLSIDDKNYIVQPRKVDQWAQYERLINEDRFTYGLDHLDIKEAKPQIDYPNYTMMCNGNNESWAVKNWDNYIITEAGPKKVEDDELPIEGYGFLIVGNKQIGEGSYQGDESRAYFLTN